MRVRTALAAAGMAALTLAASALPAQAAQWNYVGMFDTQAKCNFDRSVRHAQGYPTDPTTGCYRVSNGYYYFYYA
ncbi:hypothetical protein [Nonomuraea bangladeshensis]|uniref:hypothetical protein n=1 Tax=Nonomuraea bangladeshensis TaxID=404385 RepID=UPI003C2EB137